MAEKEQQIIDREHLKALSIGYYIKGGMNCLSGLFFLIYPLMFGALLLFSDEPFEDSSTKEAEQTYYSYESSETFKFMPATTSDEEEEPVSPKVVFLGMIILFGTISFLMVSFGALTLYTAYSLAQQKRKILIYTIVIINLLSIPYGTGLGIFTILVLTRPSVAQLFDQRSSVTTPPLS